MRTDYFAELFPDKPKVILVSSVTNSQQQPAVEKSCIGVDPNNSNKAVPTALSVNVPNKKRESHSRVVPVLACLGESSSGGGAISRLSRVRNLGGPDGSKTADPATLTRGECQPYSPLDFESAE